MNDRWSLSCISYLPGSSVFWSFLAAIALSVSTVGAAGQQADCSLSIANFVRVLSYQGTCSKGLIDGKADVLYLRKNGKGDTERVRQFGYFMDGEVRGAQVIISPSSTGKPFVLLNYYPASGRFVHYVPGWPDHFDNKTVWVSLPDEFTKKAPAALTDATGSTLQAAVSSQALFAALARHGQKYYMPSINVEDLRNFFSAVSIKNPFANTNQAVRYGRVRPDPDPDTGLVEVESLDGCKFVVSGVAAKDAYRRGVENYDNGVWDGACLDGWAFGPGSLRSEVSRAQNEAKYEWVQKGHPIGSYTYTYAITDSYLKLDNAFSVEGYNHPAYINTYVSKSTASLNSDRSKNKTLTVAEGSSDGNETAVSLKPEACGQTFSGCLSKVKYSANLASPPATEPVPCKAGCTAMWEQYAGEMNAFIAENKPKVDQIIQANTPLLATATTLKQRMEAGTLAKAAAQQRSAERAQRVAQEDEAKARQLAERKRVLSAAKTARSPVASPNLDALIARAQAIKIPAPTRQQPANSPRQTPKAPAQKPRARER